MSRLKKVLIIVLVIALVSGAVVGAGLYMRKSNQKEVLVVSVESLASDFYMGNTNLEGNIATSVSQNIGMDKDMIIEEVYVQKGDSVSKGDKLISFDTTLVEMELNIARLKRQQQEQELNHAINRLASLQNGGPIEESDGDAGGTADNLNTREDDDLEPDDELASGKIRADGSYLAAIVRPMLLAAVLEQTLFEDGGESAAGNSQDAEVTQTPDTQEIPETSPDTVVPEEPEPTSPPENEGEDPDDDFISEDVYIPKPTPTPFVPRDDLPFYDPDTRTMEEISDGEEPFYDKLDYTIAPYTGTGTEEDPFVFLCSSVKGSVTVAGSFFNVMAGYNGDGTQVLHEGGYWFQLEFHQNDTITNFQDRRESCIGYYLIDGGLLEEPVNMYAETEFTLADADIYEPDDPLDGGDISGGDSGSSTLSRADAIKIQQSKIRSLKLDLQESDLNIRKLEKKASRQVVYSKLDGTVSYVGDPLTGSSNGDTFIRVKSKEGFYVKGAVSELMLDDMKEGTVLNCSSYGSGDFEARVVDVSEYPVSGESYFGDGNPNVSYYTFSAEIPDKTLKLEDQDWLNITFQSQVSDKGSIVLEKAFVRSENGVSYVYKDDNGILKKQVLQVGGNVNGGYSVLVKGGITREDKLAFPYGKSVQEGAKTKEATLDELYGY